MSQFSSIFLASLLRGEQIQGHSLLSLSLLFGCLPAPKANSFMEFSKNPNVFLMLGTATLLLLPHTRKVYSQGGWR